MDAEKLKKLHEKVRADENLHKQQSKERRDKLQGKAGKRYQLAYEDLEDAAKREICKLSNQFDSLNKLQKATGYHPLVIRKVLKEMRKQESKPDPSIDHKIDQAYKGRWPGQPDRQHDNIE